MQKKSKNPKEHLQTIPPLWAKVAGYLALSSIFGTALVVIQQPIQIHLSFILAALSIVWMVIIRRGHVHYMIGMISLVIFIHGLVCIALDTTSIGLMGKVYASTILFFVAFSMLISIFRHKLDILVQMYITCSLVVAVIGLFQGASFLFHFRPGYNFSWLLNGWHSAPGGPLGIRLNSILFEPSQVSFTMGPAIILSFYRILNIKPFFLSFRAALILLLFGLLSASSSVLVSLAIAIILMGRISLRKFMPFMFLGVIFFTIIINSHYLKKSLDKLQGLIDLFRDGIYASTADATTYTLYVHFQVAFANFFHSRGVGGGLGSHEYMFWHYGAEYEGLHNIWTISTAGNLTFRLISELGILGLFFLGGFFYIALSGLINLSKERQILHIALVTGVSAYLIRNGTYAHFGLAFYVLLMMANYYDGKPFLRHRSGKLKRKVDGLKEA